MVTIDYKKSFEKLVEQIKLEKKWTEEMIERSGNRFRFDRGMLCAYQSIEELAIKLENGDFEFEE